MFFNQIVMLARQGGKSVRKITVNLLSFLFSNDLMTKMNWNGQGGKIAFCKLELVQLIQGLPITASAVVLNVCYSLVIYWHEIVFYQNKLYGQLHTSQLGLQFTNAVG